MAFSQTVGGTLHRRAGEPSQGKLDAPGLQTAVIHAGTSRGDWSPVVEGREPATTIVRRRTERVSTITRDLANSAAASAGQST
jgi:hypothetical protein